MIVVWAAQLVGAFEAHVFTTPKKVADIWDFTNLKQNHSFGDDCPIVIHAENMTVSKTGGTPNASILVAFPITINHPFWASPWSEIIWIRCFKSGIWAHGPVLFWGRPSAQSARAPVSQTRFRDFALMATWGEAAGHLSNHIAYLLKLHSYYTSYIYI